MLAYAKEAARHAFVYPMLCFAAHTGARRSEMIRSQIGDLDLVGQTALIREKKRRPGERTSRRVPLSPFLVGVLKEWLGQHPGGPYTFCQGRHVARSRKVRTSFVPLTRNEANSHFEQTFAGSKWKRLRGWHVFRHSFASNLAARGVDQRLIDSLLGHASEAMSRRYRHLFPDQQQQAIRLVFGEGQ